MHGVLNFIAVMNTRRYFYRVIAIGSLTDAREVSHDRRVPDLHLMWQPVPPAPGLHQGQPPDPGSVFGMYLADAAGE
jgi:hypothetical protein